MYGNYYPEAEEPHSGPGVASFVISILAGFAIIGVFAFGAVYAANNPGEIDEDHPPPEVVLIGACFLAGLVMDLAALVLGVIGVAQSNRKKIFAILGLVFSGLT